MPITDPFERDLLGWTYKGIPRCAEGLTAGQLKHSGLCLFSDELMFPVAVLKRSAMDANRAWMRQFLRSSGLSIAPHGKTTMAPAIFRLQMEDGAWGMTAATVSHIRSYRKFGVDRVILANQLIGRANIDYVLDELEKDKAFEFFCFVDSIAGAEALASRAVAKSASQPVNVLIEIGRIGGRAGARGVAQALALARAVQNYAPYLGVAGVATYEGVVQTQNNGAQGAEHMIKAAVEAVIEIDSAGIFTGDQIMITAGGSAFLDIVAKQLSAVALSRKVNKVLRAGCYIVHDDGLYAQRFAALKQRTPDLENAGLRPAIEVWAHVLSIPQAGQIVCGLGKRDIGADDRMPSLAAWARPGHDVLPRPAPPNSRVSALYDQHIVLEGPETTPLQVGDLVGFGISHPCTTIDKWKMLFVVDDDYVIQQAIRTYF